MYSKKDEEKKSMDAIIEYVREWNLESSKNGLERYIKEKQQENSRKSNRRSKRRSSKRSKFQCCQENA